MKNETLIHRSVCQEIAQHSEIAGLERLMADWSQVEIFSRSSDEIVAERLVGITLCHTYLFGRFTLPTYAACIFKSLCDLPPADDLAGRVLRSNTAVIEGELFTNNIFGRIGDAHSHYHDMLEAYLQACSGGAMVELFTQREREVGLDRAMVESPLWSKNMIGYAQYLQKITDDPLTTFLLVVASEDTIAEGYKTILEHLHPHERFDKFRTFMRRHIELDQQTTGHGKASVDWLNFYVQAFRSQAPYVEKAIDQTTQLIRMRLQTYAIKQGE